MSRGVGIFVGVYKFEDMVSMEADLFQCSVGGATKEVIQHGFCCKFEGVGISRNLMKWHCSMYVIRFGADSRSSSRRNMLREFQCPCAECEIFFIQNLELLLEFLDLFFFVTFFSHGLFMDSKGDIRAV